jgi:hypothetical protein
MKSSAINFTFLLLFLFVACKDDEEVPNPVINTPNTPDYTVETIIPTGEEQYLNTDSEYIFDQEKLLTFELNLPAASLAIIDSNPAAEQYVEGSLTFEGETISPVGIRYKGSVGAFVGCLTGTDWNSPSGYKICPKLSMKVKINWNGADTKFYGLKKLQFHSQNLDDSQMRERLGYWLFRSMGVAAPRSVHARLIINGNFSGLYALTEQIDGRFVKDNFENDEGNVYKEIWPVTSAGQPESEQAFFNSLETNEDENPSVALMKTFANEIANSNSETIRDVILNRMNLEEIISYAVVDRAIRHDDGPFHWYCSWGSCNNHNYYWYEDPTEEKFHLIPWDLDNAFENIISNSNPVTPIADDWGEISNNCNPFVYGQFGFSQQSAACDRLTRGWASFSEEYDQLKTQFIEGPFSETSVEGLLDVWANQVRDAIIEAKATHQDATSLSQWESAINTLKNQLSYARTH